MKSKTTKQKTIRSVEELVDAQLTTTADMQALATVAQEFSIAISPEMYAAININDKHDPIKRQFVPSAQELHVSATENHDPIGDDTHTTIKGIVHRYHDRCLFKPVNVCAVYCRFCFRREKIGPNSEALSPDELSQAYDYIRSHPEIWEVIITGGDPLILKPQKIAAILNELDTINTVEVVRIHTRMPVADPKRISTALLQALKLKNKPVYILLHVNHAHELTKAVCKAIAMLVDAGIPLLSQSVLLRGVNDNISALSQLMRALVKNRVKPGYLHHGDLVRGTSHFRTSITEGQALLQQLRGHYSGLCQPTYLLDIPGGYGKVPIAHHYITSTTTGKYQIEDYQGRLHEYQDDVE